jgi:predicted ATPase
MANEEEGEAVEVEITVETPAEETSETEAIEAVVVETEIDHEGRISAIEAVMPTLVTRDDLALVAASMEQLRESVHEEVQEAGERITEVVEQMADEEVAETEAVAKVIAEEQTAEETLAEKVEADEPPGSKIHRWFRKWGG